jgi:hypothetical protein
VVSLLIVAVGGYAWLMHWAATTPADAEGATITGGLWLLGVMVAAVGAVLLAIVADDV